MGVIAAVGGADELVILELRALDDATRGAEPAIFDYADTYLRGEIRRRGGEVGCGPAGVAEAADAVGEGVGCAKEVGFDDAGLHVGISKWGGVVVVDM